MFYEEVLTWRIYYKLQGLTGELDRSFGMLPIVAIWYIPGTENKVFIHIIITRLFKLSDLT